MSRLKRAALAILVLSSCTISAGTMGSLCTPGNATVPCQRNGWNIGAKALYFKPSYDVDYGYGPYIPSGVSQHFIDVDPDWEWGFMIEGSYHFNTGNDLNLNWYHWKHTTHYSYAGAFVAGFPNPLFGSTRFEPQWDAVNLEFGQHVDFGEFKDIRFHAGVQYARIKHKIRGTGYTPLIVNTPFDFFAESDFNGFGPRVGTDMAYNFGNGLAIYGSAATAILVGDFKFNTAVNVPDLLALGPRGSKTAIAPELEAKLGAKYTWLIGQQANLVLDAGWTWISYLNANHFISLSGNNTESNFAIQGPYAGLKWIGNI
ncbi:Lpg1974 family pore-forming outer membrane protein [Legionella cardiaca]|uniref:Lpg1974 family pore-forming outer membrane protein n=1 Tax=Legionella cardiaca TaxID=1071983 RepID=A0ABY8ARQ9_9GAMM|nr:Lpg1974 family pore-forming outer membrane protein [Legionella cardiaca]WED42896.1 Lpg1974 family pore-forming outer membrane protein [Legionella cardiaca]